MGSLSSVFIQRVSSHVHATRSVPALMRVEAPSRRKPGAAHRCACLSCQTTASASCHTTALCRRVEPPKKRKSVGAEVNWGVRFQSDDDARRLLDSIGAVVAGTQFSIGWCSQPQ